MPKKSPEFSSRDFDPPESLPRLGNKVEVQLPVMTASEGQALDGETKTVVSYFSDVLGVNYFHGNP